MTHQYQTLLREITTPTLPGFITSCLNLMSSKSSSAASSTIEIVFQSFLKLMPRHTTIYRPFASQIRASTKLYLAPTSSDQILIPQSLQDAAQRLTILLHQTVAKGGGGAEWGKSFRELFKEVHVTADNVLRAVIEDWESTAGYIGLAINSDQEISGGGRSQDDLSAWAGVSAGVERLIGLLQFLSTYFKVGTSTPVTIPLGAVTDLIVRLLSVAIPATESSKNREGPRLNPAIDRDEKDVLWSYMPQIYVSTLTLIDAMAERLKGNFTSLSQGLLTQLSWVFVHGKHSSEFRQSAYQVLAKLLELSGKSLTKPQVSKLNIIIRTCCNDLQESVGLLHDPKADNKPANGSSQVVDSFLQKPSNSTDATIITDPAMTHAAGTLLPVIVSCIPQQFLDIALRSLVERTAILSHNKDAMLECVLNPFVGKNGAPLASIVPHLTQAYGHDSTVEILLRPRMPLVPATISRYVDETSPEELDQDEEMDVPTATTKEVADSLAETSSEPISSSTSIFRAETISAAGTSALETHISTTTLVPLEEVRTTTSTNQKIPVVPSSVFAPVAAPAPQNSIVAQDTEMAEGSDGSSDDESVHLTMQLDSDSDSEGEEQS